MKMILDFFKQKPFLLIAFIFVYFFFQHEDIQFTAKVAMGFFHANPLRLYEEASSHAFAQGSGNINYMVSTYIVFAIWELPLKIIGLIPDDPSEPLGYLIFWYKLLPTLFYFGSAIMVQKIANQFLNDDKLSNKVAFLWLVSPLAFFSQFIFGQYDSMTLFFTLWGMYYFFKKDLTRFSLVLGVATTFKYFPVFVFFPMLLVVEKDFKALIKNTIYFCIPLIVAVAPYARSPEFKIGVMGFGAANQVFGINVMNGITGFNLILFLWSSVCAYIYFFETNLEEFKEAAFKYGSLGVMFVFIFVCWHPQWLMFLSPFMILNFLYRQKFREQLIFQIIFNVVAVASISHTFAFNVDQNLMVLGLIGKWFPQVWNDVLVARMANVFVPHEQKMWIAFFNALLVISIIFTFRNFKLDSEKVTSAEFDRNQSLVNAYIWNSVLLFPILAVGAYLMTVVRWNMIH